MPSPLVTTAAGNVREPEAEAERHRTIYQYDLGQGNHCWRQVAKLTKSRRMGARTLSAGIRLFFM
jgi:hypothetical protein